MGLFSSIFQEGAVLYVKCMGHAAKPPEPLASLVSVKDSPLPVVICPCKVEIAIRSGDMHMRIGNRQSNWQVPIDWGCRSSPVRAGHGSAVQDGSAGCRQNRHYHWRFAFHWDRQHGWRVAWFWNFSPSSIIKEEAPESAQLRFFPLLPLLCYSSS